MSEFRPLPGAPTTEEPGDAELITAVRSGDVDAYGELFARHVDAARRLARQLVSSGDVDDLVSDAFAKVLTVLQRGEGPDLAFRAYLLTALRRLHIDRIRATSRLHTTDDLTPFDPGVPFRDTAVDAFDSSAAARAFASLPERWQTVLWHVEVEGQRPAEVAVLLGISANSVSALAYRAREGLRQAFVSMHAQETVDEACAWSQGNLGGYIRKGLSRRDSSRVESHLGECRRCMAVYLELTDVNSSLAGILGPLVLGGAAAAYVGAGATGLAVSGTLFAITGRVRDFVGANAAATAVAGVAFTAVLATGVGLAVSGSPEDRSLSDGDAEVGAAPLAPAPSTEAPAAADGSTTRTRARPGSENGPRDTRPPPAAAPLGPNVTTPTPTAPSTPLTTVPTTPASPNAPTSDPGDGQVPQVPDIEPTDTRTDLPTKTPTTPPSTNPTGDPTDEPTIDPTDEPTGGPTSPVTEPTDDPTGEPTDEPTDPTTDPTDEPTVPARDLSVSATSSPTGLFSFRIATTVAGLPAGESAVLSVSTQARFIVLTVDSRCRAAGSGTATCPVTTTPSTFAFTAVSVPGLAARLTFSVTSADGTADADPTDDSTTVVLRP